MFLQSLTEFARLAALVTTCCRQEKEHTKEVESMQLEINDLHAQLTTLRNALAATQVKRLCLALCGALRVQLICICRDSQAQCEQTRGTDHGALPPRAVGVKHAASLA